MSSLSARLWLFAALAAGVLAWPSSLRAQATGQVSGTVTGEAGQPLAGASVTVGGTALGAVTGEDGRYTIQGVPAGQRAVRATRIGYAEQSKQVTVAVGQTAAADFQLTAQAVELEGVVAVGYGTQRKVNLTGAVSAVSGEELAEQPVAHVSQALQGLSPGLVVQNNGGEPGRDQADIKIRGIGTLGNSNPLLVIDGVSRNSLNELNSLDPDDIESVSILKDAASAAIYGSRAANGVILVTTKRGGSTGDIRFQYHGRYGTQDVTSFPEPIGIGDYMMLVNEAYVNAGRQPRYSDEYREKTLQAEQGLLSPEEALRYPNTRWADLFFSPAPVQDHTLRVSGGNDLARFALSLSALDQDGMVAQTWNNMYRLRLNTDFTASERLTGGVDLALRAERDSQPHHRWAAYFYLIHDAFPTAVGKFPDGTYGWPSTGRNPLAYAETGGNRERAYDNGIFTGRLNYGLLDGLTLRTQGSLQTGNWVYTDFRTEEKFYNYWDRSVLEQTLGPTALWRTNATDVQTNVRSMLDYDDTFGDHALQAVLGYEQITHDWEEVGANRENFYNNSLRVVNLGDPSTARNWGRAEQWRLRSGFGRVNYNYAGRYLLEANARYDGSSRFAEGKRYGLFPSLSAGWRISEEPFFNVGWIDELKLRGSWGKLGNQEIGLYQYYPTINLGQSSALGRRLVNGAATTALANENISWETTVMTDVGVDATFLDGRLAFTGDVYRRNTEGILLRLPIPDIIGRSAPYQNAGKVRNTGWETQLSWRDAVGEDFDYSVGFNLSDNVNEVVDLVGTGPYVGWYTARLEGQPIDVLYGYRATGLFQSAEEVRNHAKGLHPRTGPGDVRYEDVNGDGIINQDDKVPMGSALPRYVFGVNLSAAWKGLDARVFFEGVGKQDSYVILGLAEGPSWGQLTVPLHLDRWTPENRDARAPRPLLYATHNTIPSTWWVMDGKYAQLQNAQLSYTLPSSWTERMGTERLQLYVSGQNLYSWTAMGFNLDPEAPTGVFDYYPQTRVISVGTNITF